VETFAFARWTASESIVGVWRGAGVAGGEVLWRWPREVLCGAGNLA